MRIIIPLLALCALVLTVSCGGENPAQPTTLLGPEVGAVVAQDQEPPKSSKSSDISETVRLTPESVIAVYDGGAGVDIGVNLKGTKGFAGWFYYQTGWGLSECRFDPCASGQTINAGFSAGNRAAFSLKGVDYFDPEDGPRQESLGYIEVGGSVTLPTHVGTPGERALGTGAFTAEGIFSTHERTEEGVYEVRVDFSGGGSITVYFEWVEFETTGSSGWLLRIPSEDAYHHALYQFRPQTGRR